MKFFAVSLTLPVILKTACSSAETTPPPIATSAALICILKLVLGR